MPVTGDRCERCHVGTLHTYCSRTIPGVAIVRYFRCRACGHRPADNKAVLSLDWMQRILGKRASVVLDPLAQSPEREKMERMNATDPPKLLLTSTEVAERLGVRELDLAGAVLQGRFPQPVTLDLLSGGPGLYSWPAILKWLEDGCPVVRADLARAFIEEHRDEIVATCEGN